MYLKHEDYYEKPYNWNKKRFKYGDTVFTPLGKGTVIGIDLPMHRCWRWVVKIKERECCFFDKDIKIFQEEKKRVY
jgi:hypothetical protein